MVDYEGNGDDVGNDVTLGRLRLGGARLAVCFVLRRRESVSH